MSHPRRKDLFVAWSKAMVEGSTVDKPLYRGTKKASKKSSMKSSHLKARRRRRRKKKKNAQT